MCVCVGGGGLRWIEQVRSPSYLHLPITLSKICSPQVQAGGLGGHALVGLLHQVGEALMVVVVVVVVVV